MLTHVYIQCVIYPFGHKSAHFDPFLRNKSWPLNNAPALSEVVGRALEVVGGALK